MTRNIDELSNLQSKVEEPEEYFGKMNLTKEQTKKRIEYTEKANELFDLILILLLTMNDRGYDRGYVNYSMIREMLEIRLRSLISEYATPDDYLIDYAADFAYNFVDTTKNHIDQEYYTSSARALFNAENSANDVLNYVEYERAIEEGKTHKKWITENDVKVRETHRELNNKILPIKEFYYVGGYPMRFPKDMEYAMDAPQETVNCRCRIKYFTDELLEVEEASRGLKGDNPDGVVDIKQNSHKALKQRISKLGENQDTSTEILNKAFEMLYHRSGTHFEDLAYVDSVSGKGLINKDFDYYDEKTRTSACKPSEEMEEMREQLPFGTVIGLHNHPASTVPSVNDFIKCRERGYKYGLVFTHKSGIMYQYFVDDNPLFNDASYLTVDNTLADLQDALYNNDKKLRVESLKRLSEYGIDLRIIK